MAECRKFAHNQLVCRVFFVFALNVVKGKCFFETKRNIPLNDELVSELPALEFGFQVGLISDILERFFDVVKVQNSQSRAKAEWKWSGEAEMLVERDSQYHAVLYVVEITERVPCVVIVSGSLRSFKQRQPRLVLLPQTSLKRFVN